MIVAHPTRLPRFLLLAGLTIVLCSCRGLTPGPQRMVAQQQPFPPPMQANSTNAPPIRQVTPQVVLASAVEAAPQRVPIRPQHGATSSHIVQNCPHCNPRIPCLVTVDPDEPWAPRGTDGRWPHDEYLCDGGDRNLEARVRADWSVVGLDMEDTVGHFDTVEGETRVTASNRVCIYAPRFASVRKVISMAGHEQHIFATGVDSPEKLILHEDTQIATTSIQRHAPRGQRVARPAGIFRERLRTVGMENVRKPSGYTGDLLPYENFQVIRHGQFDQSEKARLAERTEAAVAWTHDLAVQALLSGQTPVIDTHDLGPQQVYTFQRIPGRPELRVVKIASVANARPGEFVEFTLRFDNVGDEVIGNVTLIDNLTPRLEYVPESAECSLSGDFFSQVNEGSSLVLRWEIHDPLQPGDGGIIRFRCKVR